MKPATAHKILTRWMHWTPLESQLPPEPKLILLGVPHSSIWDFVVAWLFYRSLGGKPRVMIKKEFFFWPLGPILRACGAVPVERSSAASMVKSLITHMEEAPEFHLAIAPEGTRKPAKNWKSGYHLIARETGATVYLGYYDWGRKRISVGEPFELSEDPKADMKRIYDHYRPLGLQGRHKDQFIVP